MGEPRTIPILMDEDDFSRLSMSREKWAGFVERQWDRFENYSAGVSNCAQPASTDWTWAYWLGGTYTALILAKSFLASRGQDFEVVFDLAESPEPSWVILTDYDDDARLQAGAQQS